MSNRLALEIASAVFRQELEFSRMLRHPHIESYDRALKAMDETYNRALDPDRPAVLTTFRPIR
jgi:hypothetical protein